MKLRGKFTLWISLAALSTAICFATFLYYELTSEFYEQVDYELAKLGDTIFAGIAANGPDGSGFVPVSRDYPDDMYWIKIYTGQDKLLYTNKLAGYADLPRPAGGQAAVVKSSIPVSKVWIPAEELDELSAAAYSTVPFRVRVYIREYHGRSYLLHLAKPILLFNIELIELVQRIALGIGFAIVLTIIGSYLLAGRLVQPLAIINSKIKDIRENSLNTRIPLPKSRDELYILSESLNSMFDRLQHSFQRQKEFISNASHEMKSPLTVLMLGYDEMLAGNPSEKIRPELEKQLQTLRRLNRLVRDLLDIARLEQQEYLLREPVQLDVLIKGILSDYSDLLEAEAIAVEVDMAPILLSADHDKLLRLFINLIDNAIKYCRSGDGLISISARVKDATVSLTIANNGRTIPATDLPHIFKQFYRVEKSRSKAFGGTGLGLTIARRIVELHGGTISVTSDDQQTIFLVSLPVTAPFKHPS